MDKAKPALKLEDMCGCNKTLPLRNILKTINGLYAVYSQLKENPMPLSGYVDSINEVMESLSDNFECYGQIVSNQLRHAVMLKRYEGKICCAGCKTEIAFPSENIETALYFVQSPERPEISSLN